MGEPTAEVGPRSGVLSNVSDTGARHMVELGAGDEETILSSLRCLLSALGRWDPIADGERAARARRDQQAKKEPKHILRELLRLTGRPSAGHSIFEPSEQVCRGIVSLAADQLFRSPIPADHDLRGPDCSNWETLRLVHELVFRTLEAADVVTALPSLDARWISGFVALFDSPIAEERMCVQKIVHRIYLFPSLRVQIRQSFRHAFTGVAFDSEQHRGIAEMLELYGSIALGFAVPLQEGHVEFLKTALLPLHRSPSFLGFGPHLVACIATFLNKDPSLLPTVVDGLLARWTPRCGSAKELMLLDEVHEILSAVSPKGDPLDCALPSVAAKLATCVSSLHFRVAEKALELFRRKRVVRICRHHLPTVLAALVGPLRENIRTHWNRQVRDGSRALLDQFARTDPALFSRCLERLIRSELSDKRSCRSFGSLSFLLGAESGGGAPESGSSFSVSL